MQLVNSKNLLWSPKKGYSKQIYLNENDLGIKGGLVQKIKIKSGEIAKSHFHKKQTEIFYFLNEEGYFIVNNKKIKIKKNDVLVIEPFDKHTVINNSKHDFLYIAFKFNYSKEDLYWD